MPEHRVLERADAFTVELPRRLLPRVVVKPQLPGRREDARGGGEYRLTATSGAVTPPHQKIRHASSYLYAVRNSSSEASRPVTAEDAIQTAQGCGTSTNRVV